MKGLNWVKLGVFFIPFGFISQILFILFDSLWKFYFIGDLAMFTFIIAEVLGLFSIFYGRRKSKHDFSSALQDVIQEKGKVTPSDLERIEQNVFGSFISFGSVRFGWGGAHNVVLADDNDLLKLLWVTARVQEVMGNEE